MKYRCCGLTFSVAANRHYIAIVYRCVIAEIRQLNTQVSTWYNCSGF